MRFASGKLNSERTVALVGLALGAAFTAYYLHSVTGFVLPGDPGEMQVLGWAQGLGHSIGYPLYLLICHLSAVLLPFGNPAFRVTAVSAFFGGIAIAELFWLISRQSRVSRPARVAGAAAAAAVFGTSLTFWRVSTFAEMYSLHVAAMLSVAGLAFLWDRNPENPKPLASAAFLLGAMMGNHLSTIALLPAFGSLAISEPGRARVRLARVAIATAALAVGFGFGNLLPFWLAWRQDIPFDFWHKTAIAFPDFFPGDSLHVDSFWSAWNFSFFNHQYSNQLVSLEAVKQLGQLALSPVRIAAELSPVALVIAGFGWWKGSGSRRMDRTMLLLMATVTLFALSHAAQFKPRIHLLPVQAIVAFYLGLGLSQGLAAIFKIRSQPRALAKASGLVALVIAAWLLWAPAARRLSEVFPSVGEALAPAYEKKPGPGEWAGFNSRLQTVSSEIPDGAVIFTHWGLVYPLEYVNHIQGRERNWLILEFLPAAPAHSVVLPLRYVQLLSNRPASNPARFLEVDPAHFGIKGRRAADGLWLVP